MKLIKRITIGIIIVLLVPYVVCFAQNSAEKSHSTGLEYAVQGKINAAKNEFNKAVKIDPNYKESEFCLKVINDLKEQKINGITAIYFFKGLLHLKNNNNKQAIAEFNKAIELNPDYDKAYNNRGLAYKRLRRYDQAFADFTKTMEINPKYAAAYNNRALVYEENGYYNEAIADATKSLEIDPTCDYYYNTRGMAYNGNRQYNKAIADFNKALEISPNYDNAFSNRGISYYRLKLYDKAIADHTKALEIDPKHHFHPYNRGLAYRRKGLYELAISDYTIALKLRPKWRLVLYNRGKAYADIGEYAKAIADYNKILEINPSDSDTYVSRGAAYAAQELYDKAIGDYTKALKINPKAFRAYNNRGNAYRATKQQNKAIKDYTQTIKINPKHYNAYYGRGHCYWDKANWDKAISDYSKALEINPRFANAYYARGLAYGRKENYTKAAQNYAKAIQIKPGYTNAHFNLSRSYLKAGNEKKACNAGKQACDKGICRGYTDLINQGYCKQYQSSSKMYHVYDQVGLLSEKHQRKFNQMLGSIFEESDIDISFVFLKSLGDQTIEEVAVKIMSELRVGGKSSEARGVLILYDASNKNLRIEIGYDLEKYLPDGFVSYLINYHTDAFFLSGDLKTGLNLLVRMLHHRIREQALGRNFDPRFLEKIRKPEYLSGGAGVTAGMPRKWQETFSPLPHGSDVESKQFVAQSTPDKAYKKYLDWLSSPTYNPKVNLFTQPSQNYLAKVPMTKAYFHYMLMLEYGKSYKIETKDSLALLYFTDDPMLCPHFFVKTDRGWLMDLIAEINNTENRVGGFYTWNYRGRNDVYTKTFNDKLININSHTRIAGGDNRKLPIRSSF